MARDMLNVHSVVHCLTVESKSILAYLRTRVTFLVYVLTNLGHSQQPVLILSPTVVFNTDPSLPPLTGTLLLLIGMPRHVKSKLHFSRVHQGLPLAWHCGLVSIVNQLREEEELHKHDTTAV